MKRAVSLIALVTLFGARARAQSLTSSDVAKVASVLRAADTRELDSVALSSALATRSPYVRLTAARALAQLAPTHRERAIPWLRALTSDTQGDVAAAATFGLGLVRDSASVPLLARDLERPVVVATAAAWSLGEIGLPARPAVARALGSARYETVPRLTPPVVHELLLAAAKGREFDLAVIAPYLASRSASLRAAAAYAIARPHLRGGVRVLLAAGPGDAEFRAEVARGLTRQAAGDSLRDNALARLAQSVHDSDPHVRILALRSAATFGDSAAALVVPALRDPDANVRITAAASLPASVARDGVAWRSAWSSDTSLKFRRSLLESALAADVVPDADSVWLSSPVWSYRFAAVAAWGRSPDTAAAARVALVHARDPDGRVRAVAYEILVRGDSSRRSDEVRAALTAAASDSDVVARAVVLPASHEHEPPQHHDDSWYLAAVRDVIAPTLLRRAPRARIVTDRGLITISLAGADAPLTSLNFMTLARRHYFDGARFHRVVPAFVAQDGDPRGDGNGGPGYTIRDELTLLPYDRGAVGMALSGPDTGGSQYFLTLTPQPHLDGHYTVFGRVVGGFAAMDSLVEGDAIHSVTIVQ